MIIAVECNEFKIDKIEREEPELWFWIMIFKKK